jgi:hypothetical protein
MSYGTKLTVGAYTEVFVRDVKVSDHVGKDGDETFGKFQARFCRVQKTHV